MTTYLVSGFPMGILQGDEVLRFTAISREQAQQTLASGFVSLVRDPMIARIFSLGLSTWIEPNANYVVFDGHFDLLVLGQIVRITDRQTIRWWLVKRPITI